MSLTSSFHCHSGIEHQLWLHIITAGAIQRNCCACIHCSRVQAQAPFCTGVPQEELPPAGAAEDFEYALRLHLTLNGRATNQNHPQKEDSRESSDATLAWNLHREWNREEGGGAGLSSFVSDDDKAPAKLCAVCTTRPAVKSSAHTSR